MRGQRPDVEDPQRSRRQNHGAGVAHEAASYRCRAFLHAPWQSSGGTRKDDLGSDLVQGPQFRELCQAGEEISVTVQPACRIAVVQADHREVAVGHQTERIAFPVGVGDGAAVQRGIVESHRQPHQARAQLRRGGTERP